uniref:Venom fibrillin 1 n=1 Tax=Pristhesancus plagipennis TaxID=1955184 RepID=A0A1Q1NPB2_PRIPG|nr:venom fibrillin 1 [Pristhesancus plagipennis]
MSSMYAVFSAFLLALLAIVYGEDPAILYYKDLNCAKIEEKGKPAKYDCSIVDKLKEDKCYYNGKEYAIDETIKDDIVKDKCIVECTCSQIYQTNEAQWSCVDIECPELFHYEPQCKQLYDGHDKCCSTSKVCGDETPPSGTCEYAGKTYYHGEKFYPKEEPCKWCICGEGFNGSLTEPWCRKFSCNVYLHYLNYIRSGCIPAYFETNKCCPVPVWRCPKEDDRIISTKTVDLTKMSSDKLCKFGNLTLAIGQKLSPSADPGSTNVQCSCHMPPYITCIMRSEHQ